MLILCGAQLIQVVRKRENTHSMNNLFLIPLFFWYHMIYQEHEGRKNQVSNSIEVIIREAKPSMTKAERAIAEYMETELYSIAGLSLKELAQRICTSEATIVRFCKSLGFKGYRDFVIQLSKESGSRKNGDQGMMYTDIRPGDSLETIVDNVCFNNIQSITDTKAVLNLDALSSLVDMIGKADRLYFFGIGASGLVCMDAYQKFMRINKKAWALTDSHAMKQTAALLTENDLAIFISYSGKTAEIVAALNIAMKTGAKTASISKYSRTNICSKTDVALFISSPEVTIRSGAMGSRLAMLNVIDIIFSAYASSRYDEVKEYLDKSHDVFK